MFKILGQDVKCYVLDLDSKLSIGYSFIHSFVCSLVSSFVRSTKEAIVLSLLGSKRWG